MKAYKYQKSFGLGRAFGELDEPVLLLVEDLPVVDQFLINEAVPLVLLFEIEPMFGFIIVLPLHVQVFRHRPVEGSQHQVLVFLRGFLLVVESTQKFQGAQSSDHKVAHLVIQQVVTLFLLPNPGATTNVQLDAYFPLFRVHDLVLDIPVYMG